LIDEPQPTGEVEEPAPLSAAEQKKVDQEKAKQDEIDAAQRKERLEAGIS